MLTETTLRRDATPVASTVQLVRRRSAGKVVRLALPSHAAPSAWTAPDARALLAPLPPHATSA